MWWFTSGMGPHSQHFETWLFDPSLTLGSACSLSLPVTATHQQSLQNCLQPLCRPNSFVCHLTPPLSISQCKEWKFIIFTIYYFTILNNNPCLTPIDSNFVQWFSGKKTNKQYLYSMHNPWNKQDTNCIYMLNYNMGENEYSGRATSIHQLSQV